MSSKPFPIWTPISLAVASGVIAERCTGNIDTALGVGIAVLAYAFYMSGIYSQDGKDAMKRKLKEHVIAVASVGGGLVASFVLAGWVANLFGLVEHYILVWFGTLLVVSLTVGLLATRTTKK